MKGTKMGTRMRVARPDLEIPSLYVGFSAADTVATRIGMLSMFVIYINLSTQDA